MAAGRPAEGVRQGADGAGQSGEKVAAAIDGLVGSSTNTISSPFDPIAVFEMKPVAGAALARSA
jgi:hypothetical protein